MGMSEEAYRGSQQRALADLELEALRAQSARQQAMIAELREANEHLVKATVNAQCLRDDAEAANRRQNEFLAMLAHELRNPLSPISMAATLLERIPDASPQLRNLRQVIGRQVDHMAHLLDDLLDAARISSGKITLEVHPLRLAEVIEQAVKTVQPRIRERGQQLQVDQTAGDLIIEGDKVRLTQVFSNLLANASKYTGDHGHIALRVEAAGDAVCIEIADDGAGIAPEVIPHIFDLFTQGPRSLARSEGGLGVGLNVVRNLIGMHGGKVEAHSAGLGSGATFRVLLPVSSKPAQVLVPQVAPVAAGEARRVLLIEDNVDACITLGDFLLTEGHSVSLAYDGISGLDAAVHGEFDVIVCDIGLPGIDGFDVVRRLGEARADARPMTVALSGYCQSEDRERALDAGFDHYFVKPLKPEDLLALINPA
jgi:signal transduction histidine kinase